MSDAVIHDLREGAEAAFLATSVRFAYLFGSHARGDALPRSDVDVAVSVGDDTQDRLALILGLKRRIHEHTGLECDIVVVEDVTLRLLQRILRDGMLIYDADPTARVRFVAEARRRAGDFAIHADRLDRELLRAIGDGRR